MKKEMKESENLVNLQVFVSLHCIDMCISMHADLYVQYIA